MEDAYVIGIRLALDNGVSEGVAAIRGELAALDRAVAASATQLTALRRAASSALQSSSPLRAAVEREIVAGPKPPAGTADAEPVAPAASVTVPLVGAPPIIEMPRFTPPLLIASSGAPSAAAKRGAGTSPTETWEPAARSSSPHAPAMPVAPGITPGLHAAPAALPPEASSAASPVRDVASPVASAGGAVSTAKLTVEPERPVAPRRVVETLAPAGVAPMPRPTPVDFGDVGRRLYVSPMSRDAAPAPQVVVQTNEAPLHAARVRGQRAVDAESSRSPQPPPLALPKALGVGVAPPSEVPVGAPRSLSDRVLAPPRNASDSGPRVAALAPPPPISPQSPVPAGPRAVTRELPSAVPPADPGGAGRLSGDVYLDGARVGRWMANRMEREANRPPVGPTFFNTRQSPAWGGATVGM